MKIAIVDDNPYSRSLIKAFLKKKNIMEISEYSSVDDVQDEKLVFLELDFDSRMNGKKAIEFIENNDLKKCIVIAFPGEENIIKEAIDKGAVDFLIKPFSEERFEKIYKKFLVK